MNIPKPSADPFLVSGCLVFLLCACLFLHLPGLHYDEVAFANAALGNIDNSFITYELKIGSVKVPLMIMPYIGALKALIYAPIFKLWDPSPITVRVPVIILGLLTLIIIYKWVVPLLGHRTAWIATLLVATDPSYIYNCRVDFGPVALMMLFKMGSLYCLTQFVTTNRPMFLGAGSLLLGLGLYDKVNFTWYITALLASALLLWPKKVLEKVTWKNAFIAASFLVMGCWPLLLYNLETGGETFTGQVLIPDDFFRSWEYRMGIMIETLNGSSVYRHVNNQTPLGWSCALTATNFEATITPWILLAAAVTAGFLLLSGRIQAGRTVMFPVVLAVFIILQICLTYRQIGWHHFMMVHPFLKLALAHLIATLLVGAPFIGRDRLLGRITRPVARVVLVLLITSNLMLNARYLSSVYREGGRGFYSDAIYELASYAQKNANQTFLLMDWGFNNQLLLLSRGAISKEEIFWMLMEDRPEAEKIEYLHSRALEPSTVFVFHAEPHAIFAEPRALFHTMLSRYNLVARNVRTFRHRRGDPIYLVYKVETKLQ